MQGGGGGLGLLLLFCMGPEENDVPFGVQFAKQQPVLQVCFNIQVVVVVVGGGIKSD